MQSNLQKLLEAREQRDAREQSILKTYHGCTLITIRANYAGENKNTLYSHLISYTLFLEVQKKIKPVKIFHELTFEGLIFFVVTKDAAREVKAKTVSIEEEFFLGRLADLDVRTAEKMISRSDFRLPPRRCLLCNNRAVFCVRNRTHPIAAVLKKTIAITEQFFTRAPNMQTLFSRIARASMLEELCRTVSLGCVNVNSNGSHHDMDFLLMLKGIDVIADSMRNLRQKNIKNFAALRAYGAEYEKKLLEACGDVNTYKGVHFLLLILSAAALQTKNYSQLQAYSAKFSLPCLQDLPPAEQAKPLSVLGIRGEAVSGFSNHFNIFLPLLENGADYETITLKILQHTYDTTTIKRGGIDALHTIQRHAQNVRRVADLEHLNTYCLEHNLSTGGVADNFIITYALYLLKKYGGLFFRDR